MPPSASNQDSQVIDEDSLLAEFRSIVESNSKTSCYQLDDKTLLKFMRARCYNLKECHNILSNYLTVISERADLFTWKEDLRKLAAHGIYYHYPVKNVDGTKIVIIRPGAWDTGNLKFLDWYPLSFFLCEITLRDEDVQRNGITAIIDSRNVTWGHLYAIGIGGARLASHIADHCFPYKLKAIHIIHENRLTSMGYNLFKPFLSEELRNTLHFHGSNLDKLYSSVPKSNLPPSLGGTGVEFTGEDISNLIVTNKDSVTKRWESLRQKIVIQ